MSHDGMPRAYLRIDPNIDMTIPDLETFIRLLCAAQRQPERGRFKDRALLDRAIGRTKATKAIARGDVVTLADGRLYVVGWDEWQEGDWTVAERMRRMRARRANRRDPSVTPVTVPSSPPRTNVTTDAVELHVEGTSSTGVGDGDVPPNPPPSGGPGSRSNGTSPRQLAKAEREAELERQSQQRLARTQADIAALNAVPTVDKPFAELLPPEVLQR